ncbi:MAG: glutaredoxin domain-containing protein [Candidatus Altiarchaeota archaeon]
MSEEKKVKVYSTPTCPYCKMAKAYLEENNIGFDDINVAEDQKAAQEMVDRSGQMGVPQLLIGDKVIVGFDKDAINEALGL